MYKIFFLLFALNLIAQPQYKTGNVIFIHPDGTSYSDWNVLRILDAGPDGEINWDKLSAIGLYQGHIKDKITSSSNAGATIHAYGVKANYNSFGMIDGEIPVALSGKRMSIMQEAMEKGIKTGLINSGTIVEPGSAVYVASEERRSNHQSITSQVVLSGTDLILSGGEEWMLPEGVDGFHGKGKRTDGINLIEEAIKQGYKVVYTRDELFSVSPDEEKILGVFALVSTFNDKTEEDQKELGLPDFIPTAPRVNEMTAFALEFFKNKGQFFLVIEEEGTDNFGNKNNAKGKIESLRGADLAIGEILEFMDENPNTLLVNASDSDAGGMQITGSEIQIVDEYTPLPANDRNGAPIDGREGTVTPPFVSAPDKYGTKFLFGISWAGYADVTGSVVARAHGLNAEVMHGKIDNTFIYKLKYLTLFGKMLE